MALGTNYRRNNAPIGNGGCQISTIIDVKPCHRIATITRKKPFKIEIRLCEKCAKKIEERLGKE